MSGVNGIINDKNICKTSLREGMRWEIQHKKVDKKIESLKSVSKPAFHIDKRLQNKLNRITRASAKHQLKLF